MCRCLSAFVIKDFHHELTPPRMNGEVFFKAYACKLSVRQREEEGEGAAEAKVRRAEGGGGRRVRAAHLSRVDGCMAEVVVVDSSALGVVLSRVHGCGC